MSTNKDRIKDAMKNPRQKKTPLNAFLETETTLNNKNEQTNVSLKSNTNDEKSNEQGLINDHDNKEVNTEEGFWKMIEEEKKKRKTIEDSYTRQTYLIRNDLLERFENIAKSQPWGFKRRAINYALEKFLDEIEQKN